jgi:chromosome segregation ATPase
MDSKAPTGVSSPSELEDVLKAKQSTLEQVKDEIKQGTQEVGSLQAEINLLQSKIADVKQALGSYDQQGLQKQLDDANKSIAQKGGIAEVAIKDKRVEIDTKIKKFDDDLKAQKDNVSKSESDYRDAGQATQDADAIAKQKQYDYDELKKTPSDIVAKLGDLKSLLDQANKAEAASDYVSVYFLTGEAKAVADGVHIPSFDELNKAIRSAQETAEGAKADVAGKKVTSDALLSALSDAKRKYDAAQASRRTDLLKLLREVQR